MMKTFTVAVAAAMTTLLAMPAYAQANRPKEEIRKVEEKKPVVDEKAYKAALERIPESKEKYDPWGVARPAEPAKKNKIGKTTGYSLPGLEPRRRYD